MLGNLNVRIPIDEGLVRYVGEEIDKALSQLAQHIHFNPRHFQ